MRIYKSDKTEANMKVPTIWKEPRGKEDCYFCNTDVYGINSETSRTLMEKKIQ